MIREDHGAFQYGCYIVLLRVLCAFFENFVVLKKRELSDFNDTGKTSRISNPFHHE